jgi:hypothetical protein
MGLAKKQVSLLEPPAQAGQLGLAVGWNRRK